MRIHGYSIYELFYQCITAESLNNHHDDSFSYHLYTFIIHTGVHMQFDRYFADVRTKENKWTEVDGEKYQ